MVRESAGSREDEQIKSQMKINTEQNSLENLTGIEIFV